jgi:hypothetical protein
LPKMGQSFRMPQLPSDPKEYEDEWGSAAREGYEDRGAFRPPRVPPKKQGSSILRVIGGVCIVGGIFWAVYLITRGGDIVTALEQNRGPVAIIALGVVVSLLGKYLRI